jgi:hypothetical protein
VYILHRNCLNCINFRLEDEIGFDSENLLINFGMHTPNPPLLVGMLFHFVCRISFPSFVCSTRSVFSAVVAGPLTGEPARLNRLPWHGQLNPSDVASTVQPRWVQTRLKAVNLLLLLISTAGISGKTFVDPGWKLSASPRSNSVGLGGSVL